MARGLQSGAGQGERLATHTATNCPQQVGSCCYRCYCRCRCYCYRYYRYYWLLLLFLLLLPLPLPLLP